VSTPIHLTGDNFHQEVLQSSLPVLVDFYASWCGPCKMMAPTLESVAEKYRYRLKVCKCDIDEAGLLAARYEIMSVPTLMVFRGGAPVARLVGAMPAAALEQELNKYL